MIYEAPNGDKTNDKMPPGMKVTSEMYPHKFSRVNNDLLDHKEFSQNIASYSGFEAKSFKCGTPTLLQFKQVK